MPRELAQFLPALAMLLASAEESLYCAYDRVHVAEEGACATLAARPSSRPKSRRDLPDLIQRAHGPSVRWSVSVGVESVGWMARESVASCIASIACIVLGLAHE
jgi:hypothetical protein